MRNDYLKFSGVDITFIVPGDLLAAILIWMEINTGDPFVIDFFVAVMVTGGLFYSFFVAVMNKMFKNEWRF